MTKTTPDNNCYWDTMTGTNSSNDRLILRQNEEINSNEYFSYNVFSGMMESSTTWNGNAIAQSPRKMSEFRDISPTNNMRHIMVYPTIIDVILHSFIICYDLWCQLPFLKKLSIITEALFSVRCLRCVMVVLMYTNVEGQILRFWDDSGLSCQLNHFYNTAGDKIWCPYAH